MLSDYLKYKTPPDSEMSKCKMIWPLYPRKYGMRVGVYKSSSVHVSMGIERWIGEEMLFSKSV